MATFGTKPSSMPEPPIYGPGYTVDGLPPVWIGTKYHPPNSRKPSFHPGAIAEWKARQNAPAARPQSGSPANATVATPPSAAMHPLDLARALGAQGAHMQNHPLNGAYNAAIQAFQQSTPRANQQAIAQRMAMQGRGLPDGPNEPMLRARERANIQALGRIMMQQSGGEAPGSHITPIGVAPAGGPPVPMSERFRNLAQLSPDNPTDAARANQLEEVLRGNDMRFGPKSPESMFRQNVIRQPGMMGGVVHPMMPSYGGAAPRPAPQNNPAPSLTNQQAIDEWNANEGKARGRFMEMTPLGISASGNAYQSNPGQYAMGLNGLMGRMNKGPAVSLNERGEVVDMTGNPVTVDMMRQMSGQARSQLENQKIGGLRTNARIRNAVTDAQRGRPGALVAANADGLLPGNVLNALFPQPAPFVQVGPDGRGVGGGGMNVAMPANTGMDDKTNLVINAIMSGPGDEVTKSRLVQSILFNKAAGGATQAGATEGKLRSGSRIAKAKEAISPPTAEDITAAREQFPGDPGAFAEWGRNKGWNNEKINRALLGAYGPDVAVSAEYGANNPSFRIDPATGVASPSGVVPGLVSSIMQMFGWDKPSTARKGYVAPASPLGRGINNEGGG